MHGNVAEWCRDRIDNLPGGIDPVVIGPGERVVRGGSWQQVGIYNSSWYRQFERPEVCRGGFRVALIGPGSAAISDPEEREAYTPRLTNQKSAIDGRPRPAIPATLMELHDRANRFLEAPTPKGVESLDPKMDRETLILAVADALGHADGADVIATSGIPGAESVTPERMRFMIELVLESSIDLADFHNGAVEDYYRERIALLHGAFRFRFGTDPENKPFERMLDGLKRHALKTRMDAE